MTGRAADPDRDAVRAASLRTGLQVAGVSTGIVLAILVLSALFVVDQSRPSELLERPQRGESKIYVDSAQVLLALVVLGIGAVVVVGFASWAISRRAVEPLGTALRAQRAFVADASHELRTPLAVLSARLQVLERTARRGEPLEDVIEDARRDVAVMGALVTDLLLLAETERGGDAEPGCDLRPVLLSSAADLRLLAESSGVDLRVDVANEARVPMSEVGLRRAITILVDNAIAHAPDDSVVAVDAAVQRGRVVVRVRDEGPGIDPELRERLFQRFAHGRDTGRRRGFGIGLSLVRDLVARAGGAIEVESTSGTGTVMRMELPVR